MGYMGQVVVESDLNKTAGLITASVRTGFTNGAIDKLVESKTKGSRDGSCKRNSTESVESLQRSPNGLGVLLECYFAGRGLGRHV
jgi:hypothetical protein